MKCYRNGIERAFTPGELDGLFALSKEGADLENMLCFATLSEFTALPLLEQNKQLLLRGHDSGMISHYENRSSFDLVQIHIPPALSGKYNVAFFSAYLSPHLLFVVCGGTPKGNMLFPLEEDALTGSPAPSRVLLLLLDGLTREDARILEKTEAEITELEDVLLTSKRSEGYLYRILAFRKHLLSLRRYYQQMVDLCDALEENENALIRETDLRYLGNLQKRIDRLHLTVQNLRDAITQVREAYQSQEDINLNHIMKVFTVITTICLPLTLVTGWYGMNLNMPEYRWAFGYPAILLLSVAMVVICIWWFKKNRWW